MKCDCDMLSYDLLIAMIVLKVKRQVLLLATGVGAKWALVGCLLLVEISMAL